MLKASRVFFVIGILFALISCVSVYITLSSGDKMMDQASAFAQSDDMKAKLDKAKASIAELKANLPLHIAELAAGVAAGLLGYIGTKMRRRGTAFFILEALCAICIAAAFVSKSWLIAGVYLLALVLGFIKIMQLTKGGAVIPEE
jgi:hypothetical protein